MIVWALHGLPAGAVGKRKTCKMKKVFFIFLLITLSILCSAQRASNVPAYVVMVMGQSNAQGQSIMTSLPGSYCNTDKVYVFDSIWERLDCSTNNNQYPKNEQIDKWGFSTPLAAYLQAFTGGEIYMINYGVGGSVLYDSGWIGPQRCWSPKRRDNIFDSMTVNVNRAISQLNSSGINYEVVGLFWQQGESDAHQLYTAQDYDNSLGYFIDSLRIAISQPNLFVWIGGASVNCISDYCPYYSDTLRLRQDAYVLTDPLSAVINEDDVEYMFGGAYNYLHFSALGNLYLARIVAAEMSVNLRQRKFYLR